MHAVASVRLSVENRGTGGRISPMGNSPEWNGELKAIAIWSLYSGLIIVFFELIIGGYAIINGMWTPPRMNLIFFPLLGGFAVGFFAMLSLHLRNLYYLGSRKKDMM